jgi:hypothetical protein
MSSRALFRLFCALLWVLAARAPTIAFEGTKGFRAGSNSLVVKTEGRKGTRVFTPDDSGDYGVLLEGQEEATATTEPTAQQKLDRCIASWDAQTHITKANWRKICEREPPTEVYDGAAAAGNARR